jgi:hypothetical protein
MSAALLAAGMPPDGHHAGEALPLSVRANTPDMTVRLIEAGADPNPQVRNPYGDPLAMAYRARNSAAARLLIEQAALAVGHKYQSVRGLEHVVSGSREKRGSRRCIQMQPRREAGDNTQVQRQILEKQRSFRSALHSRLRPAALRWKLREHVLEVARFPGSGRSEIHDLASDLARRAVNDWHRSPSLVSTWEQTARRDFV